MAFEVESYYNNDEPLITPKFVLEVVRGSWKIVKET
jgi:hypothetical protein